MTTSGTPVLYVDTHRASVCRGGMAGRDPYGWRRECAIRDIHTEDLCRVANGLTREDAHLRTERDKEQGPR
jgi:hypothetical protein